MSASFLLSYDTDTKVLSSYNSITGTDCCWYWEQLEWQPLVHGEPLVQFGELLVQGVMYFDLWYLGSHWNCESLVLGESLVLMGVIGTWGIVGTGSY